MAYSELDKAIIKFRLAAPDVQADVLRELTARPQTMSTSDAYAVLGVAVPLYEVWHKVRPDASREECVAEFLRILEAVALDLRRRSPIAGGWNFDLMVLSTFAMIIIGVILLLYLVVIKNYPDGWHITNQASSPLLL